MEINEVEIIEEIEEDLYTTIITLLDRTKDEYISREQLLDIAKRVQYKLYLH
jgi:hypothetical protein